MRLRRPAIGVLASLAALAVPCALTTAEVVQKGNVRVSFAGNLTPKVLPRSGTAPVQVEVAAKVKALKESDPPRLRRISIAINRAGQFSPTAVPSCTISDIQPSTTRNALKACGSSLVGTGRFAAKVSFSQQAPFPARGKLYAFNGRYHGRPAILAHVYGTDPVPTSFTLPFEVINRKGELGTVLTASLPKATGRSGYITEISLRLGGGKRSGDKAYLSAGCPAPQGFSVATFPFAKATFVFDRSTMSSTLVRTCKVRR